MTNQPDTVMPVGQPMVPPAGQGSGGKLVKIVALVVIGVVVLCGLAGSCLFAFTLVAPLLKGTPTPGF
jgi:hypothetical protein